MSRLFRRRPWWHWLAIVIAMLAIIAGLAFLFVGLLAWLYPAAPVMGA
jgi:hypothetical protein